MRSMRMMSLLMLLASTVACIVTVPTTTSPLPAPSASPTDLPPAPTLTVPAPGATDTGVPPAATVGSPLGPPRPDEAILILSPGPGSVVTSPVMVSGIADPTFEQTLVLRIFTIDGTELALVPTIIQADMGNRGHYSVEVPFSVSGETNGFIQVFVQSARDGGITHLESVGVMLSASGPVSFVPGAGHAEQIYIQVPTLGQTITGGTVNVRGVALASFEQTLVIDVYDQTGSLVGSKPIMTSAPDIGLPGPFNDTVTYVVAGSGPGRIVVRDPSVAFSGNVHISSVEVILAP